MWVVILVEREPSPNCDWGPPDRGYDRLRSLMREKRVQIATGVRLIVDTTGREPQEICGPSEIEIDRKSMKGVEKCVEVRLTPDLTARSSGPPGCEPNRFGPFGPFDCEAD